MVTEIAKDILLNTNIDPKLVADVWGIDESECWSVITERDQKLNEYDRERNEAEVRALARDWANQIPEAYETKRHLLLERLRNAKTEKEKQERLTHYKLFTGKMSSFSEKQIEKARNYPLKDLLGTNKNIAKCPFHDDNTASMNIKNNYYHCHACNITGDSIDFVMKRDGLSFREAVLKLQ